ncbi:MAG TPA: glycosyltransferase family A protein [Caulobacteraceae bacterium]|nr:glycosyltransferase family A protein [Caulobacteraceae bacterium]
MSAPLPKVSVCVVTYNHVRYVADCLESLVAQETDFPFEIIVGEDDSTDGAREVVEAFAKSYPKLIRAHFRQHRLGVTGNLQATHNAARGAYVAHLDGDDVARPGKLAKQAALLDAQPHIVACGHRMAVISECGARTGRAFPRFLGAEFDLGKVVRCGMPFLYSSLMYRRAARRLRSSDFEIFDWLVLTDLLRSGRCAFIPEELGLYRINRSSFTSKTARAEMRQRILANQQMRFQAHGDCRPDVFASAAFDLYACVREGAPVSRAHRDLLRASLDWRSGPRLLDAFCFRMLNGAALAR